MNFLFVIAKIYRFKIVYHQTLVYQPYYKFLIMYRVINSNQYNTMLLTVFFSVDHVSGGHWTC